jgi:hypothetical protein
MSNETHDMNTIPSMRQCVMDAIKKRNIQMRPRWHFVLLSTLAALGIFIVLLTLFYSVSLSVFFLRDSGAWFATSFGSRGWFSLLHSVPWLLILFSFIFIAILEVLVQRYSFVYRKPLLLSVSFILLTVLIGGFVIADTSFHRQMQFNAMHHELLGALALAYGTPFRMPPPSDVYHGTILATTTNGFIIDDENGAGTTTIILTAKTHLPNGIDFDVGSAVVVEGDMIATGTVQAFGVREFDG